jgi:hypothetical protein
MKWLKQTFAEWRQWIITNEEAFPNGEKAPPYAFQIFWRLIITAVLVGVTLFIPVVVAAMVISQPITRWMFGALGALALASVIIARRNLR